MPVTLRRLVPLLVLVAAGAACTPAKPRPPVPVGILYYVNDVFGMPGPSATLYAVDFNNGAATAIGPSGVNGVNVGLAESSTPGVLFGSRPMGLTHVQANGSGSTPVGATPIHGLAWDAVNGLLYGSNGAIFRTIDPATGAEVTNLTSAPGAVEGLAWRGTNGLIYGITTVTHQLHAYNPVTNAWALVGTPDIPNSGDFGMAWDSLRDVLYVVDEEGVLFSVNPVSAVATRIGDITVSGAPIRKSGGLAFVVVYV